MPKICYEEKNFNSATLTVIEQANDIIAEYTAEGYTLTVRQLYYQFVARDLVPNNMQSYKRICSIVNDGRLAGLIDWEAIEDRTRNLETEAFWSSPKSILQSCAEQFKYDMWANQPKRLEIWPEKEALSGVVERIAHKYRVPYFACRGYVSQSETWRAGQRFAEYIDNGQEVIVLHLGDHDPSGIDMSRDNRSRLELFTQPESHQSEHWISLKRLALNMDQVRRYRPPPNPAKLTDSRATDYIGRFGNSSWELDALDPKVIDQIVSAEIESHVDWGQWKKDMAREKKARDGIAKLAKDWKDSE